MARKTAVELAGALYHVLDRGDRREDIFRDDAERSRFVFTLGEALRPHRLAGARFVLMRNHYPLMIETPESNLGVGMQWFQIAWRMRFNRAHRLSGLLFQEGR